MRSKYGDALMTLREYGYRTCCSLMIDSIVLNAVGSIGGSKRAASAVKSTAAGAGTSLRGADAGAAALASLSRSCVSCATLCFSASTCAFSSASLPLVAGAGDGALAAAFAGSSARTVEYGTDHGVAIARYRTAS